jgi:predicted dehydrogenase
MKKVRYAVVCAGWISQGAFLPAVEQTGNSAALHAAAAFEAAKLSTGAPQARVALT